MFDSLLLSDDVDCFALRGTIGAIPLFLVNIFSVSLGNKLDFTEFKSSFKESPLALVSSFIFLVNDFDFLIVSLSMGRSTLLIDLTIVSSVILFGEFDETCLL